MIAKEDITIETLCRILDDAAIDNEVDEDGDICIKGLHFKTWILITQNEIQVQFTTTSKFHDDITYEEALECVNELNGEYIMAQFLFDKERMRLRANYTLIAQDGLNRLQFLRSLRKFSLVFELVIHDSVAAPLLIRSGDREPGPILIEHPSQLLN